MTKQKPEVDKEVKAEVKGYGCDNDCKEYFPSTAAMKCGWDYTPKDNDWW